MLQRFKLRLGDGTVLGVDHDGLSTWLVDRRAMVQAAGSHQWHPLNQFLARERAAARRAARQKASAREALPIVPGKPLPLVYPQPRSAVATKALPLVYPKPREEPALSLPVAPLPDEPVEPIVLAEPPAVLVLPEESTGLLAPFPEPEPASHEESLVLSVDPLDAWDEDLGSPALSPESTEEHPAVAESLAVQALAEEDIPSAALELIADEPPVLPATLLWHEPVEPPLAPAPPSLQVLADDPAAPAAAPSKAPKWAPDDDLPIIRLKPLDDEQPALLATRPGSGQEGRAEATLAIPATSKLEELLLGLIARAYSAYATLLSGGINRVGAWLRRTSPVAPKGPSPLPISELPVLRLADLPEAVERGDVYASESPAWLWTKRIVTWSGLGLGVLFAALNWEAWVPRTAELGRLVVTELDKAKESRDQAERQGRALQEATQQLPHLAPATIHLVLSQSSTGVLDPPDVFYLACEAADRGRAALTSGEALELKALRAEMLDTLRPSERARVREYDGARARRLAFPFENRDVLDLFARGTLALPARSRERLQELLAKAVAAGLAMSPETAPRSAMAP